MLSTYKNNKTFCAVESEISNRYTKQDTLGTIQVYMTLLIIHLIKRKKIIACTCDGYTLYKCSRRRSVLIVFKVGTNYTFITIDKSREFKGLSLLFNIEQHDTNDDSE